MSQKYVCNWTVKRDGKAHDLGSVIDIEDAAEAAELVEIGAVTRLAATAETSAPDVPKPAGPIVDDEPEPKKPARKPRSASKTEGDAEA